MFSSVFRSQARIPLLRAALPASRNITSFVFSRAALQTRGSVPTAIAVSSGRTFSSANTLLYSDSPRDNTPSAPSQSVYIGNMPWTMTKEDLEDMFSEFGTIESVRLQTHADGRPRGFAHISFTDKQSAIAAVTSAQEEPLHVSGRDLHVDYARRPSSTYTDIPASNKIYFARFNADEPELKELLGEYKELVTDIFFLRDGNTGEKTPSGFIEFRDIETAGEVIEKFQGKILEDGTELRLSYARRRKEGPDGRRVPRQAKPPRKGHYSSRQYNSESNGNNFSDQ